MKSGATPQGTQYYEARLACLRFLCTFPYLTGPESEINKEKIANEYQTSVSIIKYLDASETMRMVIIVPVHIATSTAKPLTSLCFK